MRAAFIVIVLLALMWPHYLRAEDGAVGVLKEILTANFNDDIPSRWGKIHYRDGKGRIVGDCDCSEPRENFYADYDPIVIVSGWSVGELKTISPTKMKIPVQFTVLARTQGRGDDRAFIPMQPPEQEAVTYQVWRVKGKWKVVDEPLPRVSVNSVRKDIEIQLEDLTSTLDKLPDRDDIRQEFENYKKQLIVIYSLNENKQ